MPTELRTKGDLARHFRVSISTLTSWERRGMPLSRLPDGAWHLASIEAWLTSRNWLPVQRALPPASEPKSVVMVRLPVELHHQMKEEAKRRRVSLNLLCCEYLRIGLPDGVGSQGDSLRSSHSQAESGA